MTRTLWVWLFIAVAAVIAGVNVWWVVRGLATGAVATLHKSSGAMISAAANPTLFAVMIGLHGVVALIFGGWAALLVHSEVTGRHRG